MQYKIRISQNKKLISNQTNGFTLVELMIALAISGFLLLGIIGTYASIHGTIQASQELENSQEVIRYSAQVFSRSLKQVVDADDIADPAGGSILTVTLPFSATSCLGEVPLLGGALEYSEVYTFSDSSLTCSVNGVLPAVTLLKGIESMTFDLHEDRQLVTVKVYPNHLKNNKNFPEAIDIDIALTTVILKAHLGS